MLRKFSVFIELSGVHYNKFNYLEWHIYAKLSLSGSNVAFHVLDESQGNLFRSFGLL